MDKLDAILEIKKNYIWNIKNISYNLIFLGKFLKDNRNISEYIIQYYSTIYSTGHILGD